MVITTINLEEKADKLPVNTFYKNNEAYFQV